jgi:hypothetical protein
MIVALPLTTLGVSCYKHYVLHEPFASEVEVKSERKKVKGERKKVKGNE